MCVGWGGFCLCALACVRAGWVGFPSRVWHFFGQTSVHTTPDFRSTARAVDRKSGVVCTAQVEVVWGCTRVAHVSGGAVHTTLDSRSQSGPKIIDFELLFERITSSVLNFSIVNLMQKSSKIIEKS